MLSLILFTLFTTTLSHYTEEIKPGPVYPYHDEFNSFIKEFNKTYINTDEYWSRYHKFVVNMDYINYHNSGKHTYTLGVTFFADFSVEEWRSQYLSSLRPSYRNNRIHRK